MIKAKPFKNNFDNKCFVIFFLGLSTPENTLVYDDIDEYAEPTQDEEEKPYENNALVMNIPVSLNSEVMETIRDHMRSALTNVSLISSIPLWYRH